MNDLSRLAEVLPDLSPGMRQKLGPIMLDLLERECGKLERVHRLSLLPEEFELMPEHKINVIKKVRERTGLTLKDAKDLVERYEHTETSA